MVNNAIVRAIVRLQEKIDNANQEFYEAALSVQDIFLTCHLGFIANRPIGLEPDLDKYPNIRALVTRLEERASFCKNPILWWEPGVIGYGKYGKTPLFETQ